MIRWLGAALMAATLSACAGGPSPEPARPFVSERVGLATYGSGGRDVILVPGLTSHPDIWQPTVEHLVARGYRVHTVHVSGFAGRPAGANAEGLVSAPIAEELSRYIAEQQLDDVSIIGHSMGGTIAMMLAARHPDQVDRLMVVDMITFMGAMFGPPGTTPDSVRPVADQIRDGMAGSTPEAWEASARGSIETMISDPAQVELAMEHSRTSDYGVAGRAMHELITTDLRGELGSITAPTTVLYVAFNAPGVTPEFTDMIYQASFANLAGARLIRIDEARHFLMFDQPDRFHAEVDAFLSAE